MASPTRNPKDLKTIISANQTEGDTLASSFEELHFSAGKEMGMLRSRIDEQGQLICILKKRADEFMTRNKTLEGTNSELEKLRQLAMEDYKMENRRSEMLEMRFNELAENHEEMIKYKDEHKRRNAILEEQNAKLLKENETLFSGAIVEKDNMIAKLKSSLLDMKKQTRQKDDEHETALHEMKDTNMDLNDEVERLKGEVRQMCQKLKLSEDELLKTKAEKDVAKSQSDSASQHVKKENDLLLEQVMQRGKLLQERQLDIDKLQKEVQETVDELQASKDKFQSMEDRVNANARVIKLQAERDIADAELTQLRREYDAYKAHSNKLLEQERELNYKLRKNIL